MFYVYEWFNVDTGKVFYVGKGCGKRYKVRKHNDHFDDYIAKNRCDSRIVREFESEDDAFEYELRHTTQLIMSGQCSCNIYPGGAGGTRSSWTDESRKKSSENNVMKRPEQRERMHLSNPMHNRDVAEKVARLNGRRVFVGTDEYESVKRAAETIGIAEPTLRSWIRSGKTSSGVACGYVDGEGVRSVKRKPYKRKLSSMARKVIVDGEVFESTAAAARHLGMSMQNLKFVLKRDGRYKGHVCAYADD